MGGKRGRQVPVGQGRVEVHLLSHGHIGRRVNHGVGDGEIRGVVCVVHHRVGEGIWVVVRQVAVKKAGEVPEVKEQVRAV